MKMIRRVLCCVLLAPLFFHLQAQSDRYLSEIFDEVSVTRDVVYGINATMITLPVEGEAFPEELRMDVYEPVGDNLEQRPVMMVYHGGNFIPQVINGSIEGTRQDSSVVELCTRFAKAGYVAAAVDYRLGWNPLANSQAERALGLIQAIYRGVQDGRTCIRYFKKSVAQDGNPFAVDTSRMGVLGIGEGGGYLALGMATLTDYTDILTTTHGPGKFLFDIGTGKPIPMVVEAYHGDIEGKVLTIAPDGFFGFPAGDTTNYANHTEYNSDFQLCINIGGAIADLGWLDERDPPIITIQSAFDQIAPYEDATLIIPTSNDPILRVQGGLPIAQRQDQIGNNERFIEANINDVWTDAAIDNAATAGHDYYEALYPVTNPPNSNGFDEGVVISWWDPDAPNPPDNMGLPWSMLPHPAGGSYHTQGLRLNEGMSAEKARVNIDTVMGYIYPRAYYVLFEDIMSNTNNIDPATADLKITPNPASNEIMLRSAPGMLMRAVHLYDINGRLLRSYKGIDASDYLIERGNLATSTYILTAEFDDGKVSQKLIVK